MNIEFIEHLIEMAERSHLVELEYSEGDSRVRLSFSSSSGDEQAALSRSTGSLGVSTLAATPIKPQPSPGHTVTSSLVGIFYRSPGPDKPPFVEVGDQVEEGQTLAIVEAMKMLNPIEADRRGRIAAILPSDGQMVEYASPLFILEALE